jgi:hypothetical protein
MGKSKDDTPFSSLEAYNDYVTREIVDAAIKQSDSAEEAVKLIETDDFLKSFPDDITEKAIRNNLVDIVDILVHTPADVFSEDVSDDGEENVITEDGEDDESSSTEVDDTIEKTPVYTNDVENEELGYDKLEDEWNRIYTSNTGEDIDGEQETDTGEVIDEDIDADVVESVVCEDDEDELEADGDVPTSTEIEIVEHNPNDFECIICKRTASTLRELGIGFIQHEDNHQVICEDCDEDISAYFKMSELFDQLMVSKYSGGAGILKDDITISESGEDQKAVPFTYSHSTPTGWWDTYKQLLTDAGCTFKQTGEKYKIYGADNDDHIATFDPIQDIVYTDKEYDDVVKRTKAKLEESSKLSGTKSLVRSIMTESDDSHDILDSLIKEAITKRTNSVLN